MTHSIEIIAEDTLIIRSDYANPERDTEFIFALKVLLDTKFSQYIRDCVPAYTSIMIIVDMDKTLPQILAGEVQSTLAKYPLKFNVNTTNHTPNANQATANIIEIPCYYGEDVAWDLSAIAQQCELMQDEVVRQHSNTLFRVYAIGFSPGFPYLGYLPTSLHLPRKSNPRPRIPAGSVAIAENQSAVYPQATPGGWHIIGRTPVKMFRPELEDRNKCTLTTGDVVRFVAIDKRTFVTMGGDLDA